MKISINPFFWLVIIGALVTGQFLEIITLFGIVVIHELGHIFAAKSYGWNISEIQLLPFGGVAKVDQINDSLWEELIVAVAGPLQNGIMIFITMGFQRIHIWSPEWTTFFIEANMMIALFNLIPIVPLDGSRILKVFLFIFLPFRKAIMITLFISFVLALFFFIWASGFLFIQKININGIVLTFFFVYSNWMDVKQVPFLFWQFLLKKVDDKPKRNIPAVLIIISQDTTVIQALRLLRKERYHLFYILSNHGELLKVIPEEKVLRTIFNKKELHQPINHIEI